MSTASSEAFAEAANNPIFEALAEQGSDFRLSSQKDRRQPLTAGVKRPAMADVLAICERD